MQSQLYIGVAIYERMIPTTATEEPGSQVADHQGYHPQTAPGSIFTQNVRPKTEAFIKHRN